MRTLSRGGFRVLCLLACLSTTVSRAEEAPEKGKVKLKAKSIVFNRSTGDVLLDGEVRVVRTEGGKTLTIDCEKMTAKMKDDKMESVLATGTVRLTGEDMTASAARATFDFAQNVIRLYGEKDKPAVLKSPGVVSTGPVIVLHMAEQRVEMPDGGETELDIKSPPEPKKRE